MCVRLHVHSHRGGGSLASRPGTGPCLRLGPEQLPQVSQPPGPPQRDGSGPTGWVPDGVERSGGKEGLRLSLFSFYLVASLERDKSVGPLEASRSER